MSTIDNNTNLPTAVNTQETLENVKAAVRAEMSLTQEKVLAETTKSLDRSKQQLLDQISKIQDEIFSITAVQVKVDDLFLQGKLFSMTEVRKLIEGKK